MAKLNIYHLFATALVIMHSRRRKREKNTKTRRPEVVVRRCSSEYVFLKTSYISQEKTYVGVSF